jgi:PTS system cellobiose-specific IIC component
MANDVAKKGFMQKFMDWMSDVVSPKLESVANNAWISALQKSILKTVPMVLVGSLITVFRGVRNYVPSLPDLTPIRTYTFGLLSIFFTFLIPYYVMVNKKNNKMKYWPAYRHFPFFIMVDPRSAMRVTVKLLQLRRPAA